MTTARRLRSYASEQYLRVLDDSHIKLEFFEGELYAMAGGTPSHAQLGARLISLIQRGLPAGCAPCWSKSPAHRPRTTIASRSS